MNPLAGVESGLNGFSGSISEAALYPTGNSASLGSVLHQVEDRLTNFATSSNALDKLAHVFGQDNRSELGSLLSNWAVGEFSQLPDVQVLPDRMMNGAYGAFSAKTGTIYLRKWWGSGTEY